MQFLENVLLVSLYALHVKSEQEWMWCHHVGSCCDNLGEHGVAMQCPNM